MPNESLKQYGSRVPTPQRQPIPGRHDQIENSEGGYVFGVDKWTRLHRWLILGSEGGSYYANEKKLTFANLDAVQECIEADGKRTVSIICEVSKEGRAPKNDQAIFALAMCSAADSDATRKAAYDSLEVVCRTGTHLFQFLEFRKQFRGWSRGLRSAVARWYAEKDVDKLALQLVKYRQREGWTHRDALRKAHSTKDASLAHKSLIDWTVHGTSPGNPADNPFLFGELREQRSSAHRLIDGFERVQKATTAKEAAQIITAYNLPWECVPTHLVNSLEVRSALLPFMPIGALIRQLGLLTSINLLTPTSNATKVVLSKLQNPEAIRKSRIHPLTVLMALKTYAHGQGERRTWSPLPAVVDRLDDVFYESFGNVEASGKSRCIALDVSGSMSGSKFDGYNRFPDIQPGLSPREAAAAMAMVSMKTGDPYEVVAFTADRGQYRGYDHYTNLPQQYPGLSVMSFSPRQRLDDIVKTTENIFPGATDCSLPMLYATQARREFDVFEVYTDSETFAGNIHASQALQQYRQASGIDAKLVVVGMVSNGFSIADPRDPGMLDVVGFDSATPNIISAFAEGGF